MIKIKNEKGFTLSEVVVGAALMGIVGIIVINTFKTVNKQIKTTRNKNNRQLMMNNLVNYANRASKVIKFEDFHNSKTLYNASRTVFDPRPVSFVTSGGNGVINFDYKGSPRSIQGGTFEIKMANTTASKNLKTTGFIFSRCIDRSDVDTEFTLDQALALSNFPFVRLEGMNKVKRIHCCPRTNLNCDNVIDKDATLRPRVFYVNENKIQMYPGPKIGHEMAGAGINLYLDHTLTPQSYELVVFTLENDCLQQIDRRMIKPCKNKNIVTIRIIEGKLTSDIHDSGMLILGQ